MSDLDAAWAEEVARCCDRVFAAADVGFVRGRSDGDPADARPGSLLWEADPARFAARYPDSGIVESYGDEQWPDVSCIDYWVYIDTEQRRCTLSVEGWNLPELVVKAHGHSGIDGPGIAAVFARILDVPWSS